MHRRRRARVAAVAPHAIALLLDGDRRRRVERSPLRSLEAEAHADQQRVHAEKPRDAVGGGDGEGGDNRDDHDPLDDSYVPARDHVAARDHFCSWLSLRSTRPSLDVSIEQRVDELFAVVGAHALLSTSGFRCGRRSPGNAPSTCSIVGGGLSFVRVELDAWNFALIVVAPLRAAHEWTALTDWPLSSSALSTGAMMPASIKQDRTERRNQDPRTLAWLRRLGRFGCEIGGVSGGPFLLARAGLLRGVRSTIHWEHVPAFAEAFPDVDLTQTLFEIDGGRLTCGGGVAALDMMHAIIRRDHGQSLAGRVSDWFLQTAVRMGDSTQRISIRERIGTSNRSLIAAVAAMERQIGTPASRKDLAKIAGVSVRHLERLFAEHLDVTMHQHYVSLRLVQARKLLRQTSMPLAQVGTRMRLCRREPFCEGLPQKVWLISVSRSRDR